MDMRIEPFMAPDIEEYEGEDNGMTALADDDVVQECGTELAKGGSEEASFEYRLAALESVVNKHPLNREIMYRTLRCCQGEKPLLAIEAEIETYPEFVSCTQNQYHMIATLEKAAGLRRIERDAEGNEIFPEEKEGLSEDEIDDLVATVSFETTELGCVFVEQRCPRERLLELLSLNPERRKTYVEVLEFIGERPRTYGAVQRLLQGSSALEAVIDGEPVVIQPSVFVDKLERSGALVWKDGWTLTEEGEELLQELKGLRKAEVGGRKNHARKETNAS